MSVTHQTATQSATNSPLRICCSYLCLPGTDHWQNKWPHNPITVLSFKIVFYTDHLFSDHTVIDTLQISTSRCYIKAVSSDLCNWIYWHWQRIPSQVQVNSTDPNLSLGVLHLLAKDTSDKSSGTSYYLIENGSGIYRSIEFHDLNLQSLHY